MNYNPKEDGITHLNIYSKGNTELGRFLTNFAHCPIETEDGHFESIEGYWGWLSISEENPKRENFRKLYGYSAKKLKEDLYKAGDPGRFEERFSEKIESALHNKFQTELAKSMLTKYRDLLSLPIAHYYYFGKQEPYKVVDVTEKYPEFINSVKKEISEFLREKESAECLEERE